MFICSIHRYRDTALCTMADAHHSASHTTVECDYLEDAPAVDPWWKQPSDIFVQGTFVVVITTSPNARVVGQVN
jgi:hypothetical protein